MYIIYLVKFGEKNYEKFQFCSEWEGKTGNNHKSRFQWISLLSRSRLIRSKASQRNVNWQQNLVTIQRDITQNTLTQYVFFLKRVVYGAFDLCCPIQILPLSFPHKALCPCRSSPQNQRQNKTAFVNIISFGTISSKILEVL